MVGMSGLLCLVLVPVLVLVGTSVQVDVKGGNAGEKAGNFMEDEQWLSTISQYSRKIKHWNRFRDIRSPRLLSHLQNRVGRALIHSIETVPI
ncbi:hypothetical protein DPEC_G00031070 [Dallia pectoralis]|uniref:Uncharacterized protein n=1 Tax=Dallia pectoralis TaxID=75939 RepID=A0ACC2HC98_DALPE|nr:hypothetical protein DPEC_G00031070 [Dallia pectoralis]